MSKRIETMLIVAQALAMPLAAGAQDAVTGPLVETAVGPVRGSMGGAVEAFLGIPYAAPPVGELRWRSPAPVEPWTEARDATAFGAGCAAAESGNGPRSEAEDCLFLNVWRPQGIGPDARLPVYVYLHGGGFLDGSSNQADMTEIVAQTGVIGVSLNYRLGALGFLAHPALTAETGESGNWGLMDQQAALRWIRGNISAFGGDPARVTLGGESAGAYAVCAHLAASSSAGLFARAVLQSGSCPSLPLAEAEAIGRQIAGVLGCSGADAACLRALPVGRLIDVANEVAYGEDIPLPAHGTPFLPVVPREAVTSGDFARVPVLIGANRDEGRFFRQDRVGTCFEQEYTSRMRAFFGADADAVLEIYPWPAESDDFTCAYLGGAVVTDGGFTLGIGGCPNLRLTRDLAQYVPTYAYEFAHRTGPGPMPEPRGYEWGAAHTAELPYLFPSFHGGTPIAPTFDEGERQLASDMKAYWGAFVKGAPEPNGLAPWPAFNDAEQVLKLRAGGASAVVPVEELGLEHNCAFWDPS